MIENKDRTTMTNEYRNYPDTKGISNNIWESKYFGSSPNDRTKLLAINKEMHLYQA